MTVFLSWGNILPDPFLTLEAQSLHNKELKKNHFFIEIRLYPNIMD